MKKQFGIRVYKEYFNFAAAHFLIFDNGEREELHGHNYRVKMAIEGKLGQKDNGDANDVFIDFLHIKPIVKQVCDSIDHRTILPLHNKFLQVSEAPEGVRAKYFKGDEWLFPKRDVILLPTPNTSSERLAEYLCSEVLKLLAQAYPSIQVTQIEFSVEESRGQAALCRLSFDDGVTLSDELANPNSDIAYQPA